MGGCELRFDEDTADPDLKAPCLLTVEARDEAAVMPVPVFVDAGAEDVAVDFFSICCCCCIWTPLEWDGGKTDISVTLPCYDKTTKENACM